MVVARRESDGAVTLINENGYMLQVLSAAENELKPRSKEEVEQIVLDCGFEITQWEEG